MQNFFRRRGLAVVMSIAAAILIVEYQNCAKSGNGTGFSITLGSTSSFSVSAPTLNNTTYSLSSAFTATAQISGGSGSTVCQWMFVTSPGGSIVSPTLPSSTTTGSVCNVSGSVPSTAGTYALTVLVSNGAVVSAPASTIFSVSIQGTTPTPTPTPTHSPTPTPPNTVQCSIVGCIGLDQCGTQSTVTCNVCPTGNSCLSPTGTQSCGNTCSSGGGCACN